MNWKNIAVGMGNAAAETIPMLERQGMAEEELGMRKEAFGMQKTKFDQDQALANKLKGIATKYAEMTKNVSPDQGIGGARAASPTVGVTELGAPGVSSGTGIELGQQPDPFSRPEQVSPTAPQTTQPTAELSKANAPMNPTRETAIRRIRSNMLMETYDALLGAGRIEEAAAIKKAEFDNIFNIAKLSPKMALQTWNTTPHLVQEYGEMDPASLKETGEYVQTVVGDNLITLNKKDGTHKITKIEGGAKPDKLSLVGNTPDGRPVSFNPNGGGYLVDGQPYSGRVLPKVEKVIKEGGDFKADAKEFRREIGGLDGLYKTKASIQKGVDPFTGQLIPQDNIKEALATIQQQIDSKEEWMKTEYPDQWKTYRKPKAGAVGGTGKTYGDLYATIKQAGSSSAALKALTGMGYNEDQAKTFIKQAIQGGYTK